MKKHKIKKSKKHLLIPLRRGAPAKYSSEDQVTVVVDAYMSEVASTMFMIPSKAGLLYRLDISRPVYMEYKKKFPNAIRRAERWIEEAWVQRLARDASTGAIFYLKNAFRQDGYRDRFENENKVTIKPTPLLGSDTKKNVPKNNGNRKDIKSH